MKKLSALVLAGCLLLSLAGCGGEKKPVLNVYNWGDYIGEGVIEQFETEFNCKVNYNTFEQNEDMYTKITKSKGSYDVVIPSDYMIERMIKEDLLAPINRANIPNMEKMSDYTMDLNFDKGNVYSVPYMWGTVGIIYNKTMVNGPITSWNDLWDTQYKKQIFMMNSVRDSMAIALMSLGYDMNSRDMDELKEAEAKLLEQKDLVLAYTGDEIKDKMIAGEAALAIVYSGDASTMIEQNEDLDYVIPTEGTNLWFDNMCILKDTKNQELAEKFINFMSSKEIAAINRDYINYNTPQTEVLADLQAEGDLDERFYPSDEVLAGCDVYYDLGDMAKAYDEMWTKIMVN